MSWGAYRFRKDFTKSSRAARLRNVERSKPKLLSSDGLVDVFRTSSAGHALVVCRRLQRMKRRSKECSHSVPRLRRKHFEDRNYHHLTPKSRPGEPYYGNDSRNMCLIRRPRHAAWHKLFGLQTLEETIRMLLTCMKTGGEVYVIFEYLIALGCLKRETRNGRVKRKRFSRRRFVPV